MRRRNIVFIVILIILFLFLSYAYRFFNAFETGSPDSNVPDGYVYGENFELMGTVQL